MLYIQNVTKYVANKIKSFRESKNITQQELAEALGTTQQSIARYESGERKADQNILFMLSEYFGVSIDDFFPEQKRKTEYFDELEILFNKNKDILSADDKETIKFVIEKAKRKIDEQLGEDK